MSNRKDRLIEAYDYLRKHCCIHTKKDLADSIQRTLPTIYSAFGGNESYLTDSLFKNICDAFPHTFNLQYLLTGEGELLMKEKDETEVHTVDLGTASTRMSMPELNIIDLFSHLISDLENMRRQTQQELTLLQEARHDYIQAIRELKNISEKITLQYPTTLAAEDSQEIYNKQ